MFVSAPILSEVDHFRRLSVIEGRGTNRFETRQAITYVFAGPILPRSAILSFRDRDGKEWLRLTALTATIPPKYRWNGNSPKKGLRILGRDLWLGTPDLPSTIAASLLHDAFFQFSGVLQFPISLTTANDCYTQICRANRCSLTGIYQAFLDEHSHLFWGKSPRGSHCIPL